MRQSLSLLLAAWVSGVGLAAASSGPAEEFFIVSSVHPARSSLVLKRPTEVTLSMGITEKTRCRTERGAAIRCIDLRAGDTVYIASDRSPGGELVARTIRQGVMTLPELQRRYLRPDRSSPGATR